MQFTLLFSTTGVCNRSRDRRS
ncbi:hypothetical protein OIU76_017035, partial [Salix suchowensis]